MTTSKNYRIEKTQNGNAVDFYATHEFFATLADAQAELLAIYNNYCSDDMSAENWAEAESKERETGAWLDKANGEVMGFEYDNNRVSYAIVEYHTYDVYYCDDINEPANLKTFLLQEAAEEYIWEEMRDVTRVDAEHPCTDDVFASSSVACYRVYMDESLYDEPQAPVYESDYFYTND